MDAVTPGTTTDYICKCDRGKPTDKQTVFKLSVLTIQEDALITNALGQVTQGGDLKVNLGTQSLLALNLGLDGVENLNNKGKEFVFVRDEKALMIKPTRKRPWSDASLEAIQKDERSEIAQVIINGGELTEEQLKN